MEGKESAADAKATEGARPPALHVHEPEPQPPAPPVEERPLRVVVTVEHLGGRVALLAE